MGLAPNPERLVRDLGEVGGDNIIEDGGVTGVTAIRAAIRDKGDGVRQRIVADTGSPQVKMLKSMVRQRTWDCVTSLMERAELAAESQERWFVCRRQMLTDANKAIEELVEIVDNTLGLRPDQMPGKE